MAAAAGTVRGWQSPDRRSALAPLDAGLEYLRSRLMRVLPLYLLAMAPLSLCALLIIDSVSAGQRRALWIWALPVVPAMVWRWVGQAMVQRRVQTELRGQPPLPLWPRVLGILVIRMLANLALLWGSFLVVPPFYGLIYAGIATPLMLENDEGLLARLAESLGWIHSELSRVGKLCTAVGVLSFFILVGVAVTQYLLVGGTTGVGILPSLLGIDAADLAVTLASKAWWLCLFYLLFMVFDLYWTVASVMLFYDLQARKLGTDLRVRIGQLAGGRA